MNKVLVRLGAQVAQGNAFPFFIPLAGARDLKRSVGPEIFYLEFADPRGAGRRDPPLWGQHVKDVCKAMT